MIIDYMLDENHNGLEFIKQSNSQGKNTKTPRIMLSADNGKTSKNDAQELGVKAWVKKPFTPIGILEVVYKVLDINFSDPNEHKTSMHHRD